MTTLAQGRPLETRRRHQQHVAALLEQIEEQRRRLYVQQARGVKPAALRDPKNDLRALRRRLAAAIARARSADSAQAAPASE